VAISEQTKGDLQAFFKLPAKNIQVIGQSCDAEFERLSLRHEPNRLILPLPTGLNLPASDYLISVGSLTPRKNWHTLIQALALLKAAGTDLPLVAVGAGKSSYAQNLRQRAKENGLQVYWLDQHISTHDLALLYRRAATMVYPSVFEGFGIPILEAMTVGIPVVTTQGGCFEEVGGNAALYASPSEPEQLAEKILESFKPEVRVDLCAKIPAQIEQFSPERICSAWMKVYQAG
jgi:glycosyltransferase involved in cell wall biosynthesis